MSPDVRELSQMTSAGNGGWGGLGPADGWLTPAAGGKILYVKHTVRCGSKHPFKFRCTGKFPMLTVAQLGAIPRKSQLTRIANFPDFFTELLWSVTW